MTSAPKRPRRYTRVLTAKATNLVTRSRDAMPAMHRFNAMMRNLSVDTPVARAIFADIVRGRGRKTGPHWK